MPLSAGGCFFAMRTVVFFDGQNLFRSAKDTWGPSQPNPSSPYDWPSYDVEKLAQHLVSLTPGRTLEEVRFYTVAHNRDVRPDQYWFWTNKLNHLEAQGIYVYRGRVSNGQEKGSPRRDPHLFGGLGVYDVEKLAQHLVSLIGRTLEEVRFYTVAHNRDVRPDQLVLDEQA